MTVVRLRDHVNETSLDGDQQLSYSIMKKMNEHTRRPPCCPSDKTGHHDAVSFVLEHYSG